MGRFKGTNPDGSEEVAINEIIVFCAGVIFLALGAYLRFMELYNNKWDLSSSLVGSLTATFIMGLVFPSVFPSHPWYEHAEKLLGEVFGMTRVQWFVGLVVIMTYNFFLEQGKNRFSQYEGLTPMGMAQLGNLLLMGTSIIPGLMVVKVPDWWAMRQHAMSQEIKYVDLKLRDKELLLEAKKDVFGAYLDAVKSRDHKMAAIAGMMAARLLPAPRDGANSQLTAGAQDAKLLMGLLEDTNTVDGEVTGRS